MEANTPFTLANIRDSEGMDVNRDPGEPGGISKGGVSLNAMNDYRRTIKLPPVDKDYIAGLTIPQVDDFYAKAFLPRIRFNDLPSGVDYRLADLEVNSGQTGAIWILELALGISPLTNTMTDDLLARTKAANPHDLVLVLGAVWIGRKSMSPKWPQDCNGWTNRNNRVMRQSLGLIGAL